MSKDLLENKQFQLTQKNTLKITSLDKNCHRLQLTLIRKQPSLPQVVYKQTLCSQNMITQSQSSAASLLFLKLSLECCLSKGYQNQHFLQIIDVQNVIYDKIVTGKQNVEKALNQLKKKCNKKYEAVVLKLIYPDQILIILPKILVPSNKQLVAKFIDSDVIFSMNILKTKIIQKQQSKSNNKMQGQANHQLYFK